MFSQSFQCLNHSHASLLIEMGFNILMVSQRLGHEKVETTWRPMRIYIRTRKRCLLHRWIPSKSMEYPGTYLLKINFLISFSSSRITFRSSQPLSISAASRSSGGILIPGRKLWLHRKNLSMRLNWMRISKEIWLWQKFSNPAIWKSAAWCIVSPAGARR